mmetsp:Transcript_14350/g.34233  ORF Transcript_14350/g.34233 Transcript_14350/m.34233 type:complete len:376 (+) Transcript_14350:70-1197(+)
MVKYKGMLNLVFQREGSIVPFATSVALPCGVLSGLMKYVEEDEVLGGESIHNDFTIKATVYASFSSLLGLLVVFRTSQAYNRYFAGGGLLPQMMGSWWSAVSCIFSFCHISKAKPEDVSRLQHVLTRLVSLMSALSLVELEGAHEEGDEDGFLNRLDQLKIIDGESLDDRTLAALKQSELKLDLVFSWIQNVVVDAIDKKIISIPPPLLTRAFTALGGGMVQFQDCMKLSLLPFPFPYSQATVVLLVLHWVITPFMICNETRFPIMAAFWSFLIVFIFWGLNTIATELENPFGDDPNDLDAVTVQQDMNAKLLLLIAGETRGQAPALDASASEEDLDRDAATRISTLKSVWLGRRSVGICTNRGRTLRQEEVFVT